jgi:hypothetical protein
MTRIISAPSPLASLRIGYIEGQKQSNFGSFPILSYLSRLNKVCANNIEIQEHRFIGLSPIESVKICFISVIRVLLCSVINLSGRDKSLLTSPVKKYFI